MSAEAPDHRTDRRADLLHAGALLLVLAVSAFLRLFRLADLPPGLHQDEAIYGLDALGVTIGQLRPYFGEREPLFIYLVAGAMWLLGPTTLALRLTAALVGTLAILTTYLAARALFDRRVGLLAGATLATALWPVMISRVGFRAGTLPLVEAAALWALWAGWRRSSRPLLLLGGALAGATLYTYLAGRLFPAVLVAFLAAQGLADRSFYRGRAQQLGLALAAAAATATPLALYLWRHPETIAGRASQVTALDASLIGPAGLRELAANGLRTAGMLFVAGDANWRHNLAGAPAFLLPVAALLLLGYLVALARLRSPAHLFLAVWLPVMLLPGALSIDAPHYLRTIGAAPAAATAAGLGLAQLAGWVGRGAARWGARRGPTGARAAPDSRPGSREAVVSLGLALLALLPAGATFWSYHVVWAAQPAASGAFNAGLAAAGQHLAESELWRSGGQVFVTSRFYDDRASLAFFLWPSLPDAARRDWRGATLGLRWFDEERALPLPAAGEALYITSERLAEQDAERRRLAAVGLVGELVRLPPLGLPGFGVFRRSPTALPEPTRLSPARGETGLDLIGFSPGEPTPAGGIAELALYWQVTGPPPAVTPSVFSHLLGETGRSLAQDDQVLGYAAAQWRPGETIVTWHRLAVPPGLPPGDYSAEVGLYDRASGRRQPLRLETRVDSRVVVGPLRVRRGAATPAALAPAERLSLALGPALRLLGLDRSPGPVAPGARLPLTLYWQATAPPADYQLELALRAADGRELGLRRTRPAGERYPTDLWQPGEVVRGDLDLPLAPTTPAGTYTLGLRLLDAAGQEVARASLGAVEVAGQPRRLDPPAVGHRVGATFGDLAELVGFDLPTTSARAGGALRLTLYWRAVGETADSYTVFAHLIDGAERVWGQQDNPPVRGTRPTPGWLRGEYVVDEYELPLRPDAPAGEQRIEVGLYDPASGRRLPVRDARGDPAGDRVVLEPVVQVGR